MVVAWNFFYVRCNDEFATDRIYKCRCVCVYMYACEIKYIWIAKIEKKTKQSLFFVNFLYI